MRWARWVRRWRDACDWYERSVFVICVVGLILTVAGVACWLAVRDAVWWNVYSAAHHCARTGNVRRGYMTFMHVSCGQGCETLIPMTTPDTYEYACDDGARHWR